MRFNIINKMTGWQKKYQNKNPANTKQANQNQSIIKKCRNWFEKNYINKKRPAKSAGLSIM